MSIVGAGLHNAPGYAARMFGTLADRAINIEMISTSEVRITCMIAEADLETALRALHDTFELESPEAIDADAQTAAESQTAADTQAAAAGVGRADATAAAG